MVRPFARRSEGWQAVANPASLVRTLLTERLDRGMRQITLFGPYSHRRSHTEVIAERKRMHLKNAKATAVTVAIANIKMETIDVQENSELTTQKQVPDH